jgi:hypothetical protein
LAQQRRGYSLRFNDVLEDMSLSNIIVQRYSSPSVAWYQYRSCLFSWFTHHPRSLVLPATISLTLLPVRVFGICAALLAATSFIAAVRSRRG